MRRPGPLVHIRPTELHPFDVLPDGRVIVRTIRRFSGVRVLQCVEVHIERAGYPAGDEASTFTREVMQLAPDMIVAVRHLVDPPTAEQWATAVADLAVHERRLR